MKYLLYFGLTLVVLSQYSCDSFNCIVGEQAVETRPLTLDPIRGVEFNIAGRVNLTEGSTQSVSVTGPADALDVLDIQVVDGICQINSTKCLNLTEEIRVDLTMPELAYVEINGSGDVVTTTPFSSEPQKLDIIVDGSGNAILSAPAANAALSVDGSGDIDWQVGTTDVVTARIDGSGDINLVGRSNRLGVTIDGSGDLAASNFTTESANVDIDGSGSAYVRINQTLNARINGSGSVYYYGSPVVTQEISGSGKVEQR